MNDDKTDTVQRLLQLAGELNLPEDALDDAVYYCAQDVTLPGLNAADDADEQEFIIGDADIYASNINNGGFEEQIAYLIEYNDAETIEHLIRDAAEA